MNTIKRCGLFLLLSLVPSLAEAQRTVHLWGNGITILQILNQVVYVGVTWIVPLALTMFLVGAFWKVLFAGKEESAKKGNTIMIDALVGLGIVALSYAIIRLIFFVIY
jgi:hypothetical protein